MLENIFVVIKVMLLQRFAIRSNEQVDISSEGTDLSLQKLIDLEELNVR